MFDLVENLQYANPEGTAIRCDVTVSGEVLPFTATSDDVNKVSRLLFLDLLNGVHGPIAAYPEDLAALKARALADIDQAATRARLRYVSPNKDATYQNKALELERWIVAGRPETFDAGLYPYIEAEAALSGKTHAQVGNEIEFARNAWMLLDPQIEGQCRAGKVAVEAALTAVDVQAAKVAALAVLDAI